MNAPERRPKRAALKRIQETVARMYSEHPWPLSLKWARGNGLAVKMLGVTPKDYVAKRVWIWAVEPENMRYGMP